MTRYPIADNPSNMRLTGPRPLDPTALKAGLQEARSAADVTLRLRRHLRVHPIDRFLAGRVRRPGQDGYVYRQMRAHDREDLDPYTGWIE